MDQENQIVSSSCHCINLRRAAGAVTEYYDRKLRSTNLTLNQYSLLSNIRKIEPCSVAELSRQVRLERTTLVRNLKALYAAGWIYDDAGPGNRRSKICLTPSGIEKICTAKDCWVRAQNDIESCLGEEMMLALTKSLLALEMLNMKDLL